jgi:hypothetical protein
VSYDDLLFLNATTQAELIASRRLSAVELMRAHLEHIERVNPAVHAICTLVAEEALRAAEQADRRQASGAVPPSQHAETVGPETDAPEHPCNGLLTHPERPVQAARSRATPCGAPRR